MKPLFYQPMKIKSILFTNIDRYRKAMRVLILKGKKVSGSYETTKGGNQLFVIEMM